MKDTFYTICFIVVVGWLVYAYTNSGSTTKPDYTNPSEMSTNYNMETSGLTFSSTRHSLTHQECIDECYRRYQVCLNNNLSRYPQKDCYGSLDRHCLPACKSY